MLEPVAFLRRLVGIIPPPRRHLVRYAGIFGPASNARAQAQTLVPVPVTEDPAAHTTCPGPPNPGPPRAHRVPWADLLRRVFAQDVLACPCGGRRTIVAFVAESTRARSLLVALGLPADPATFAPARDPTQTELAWARPA